MYHQILTILYGFPGTVLDDINHEFRASSTFLHPGEKAIFMRLLDIANDHSQLKKFVKRYTQWSPCESGGEASDALKPGLYLKAFCLGLDEALEPYRQEIVKLESRILADSNVTLTLVLSQMNPHHTVLLALNAIVKEVTVKKLHGCQILQLLYQNLSTTIEKINGAIRKAVDRCHGVFFKQLSSWVLYGQLNDSHREFFIQPTVSEAHVSPSNSHCEYQLSSDLLPSYIPVSLAHKILFIGQTIVMLSSNLRDQNDSSGRNALDRPDITTVLSSDRGPQYFQCIRKLHRSKVLDIDVLDEAIEVLRSCVTEHLWRLAVEESELPQQLRLIKDMFLLGRGELFLEFIQQAQNVLDRPPTSTFSRDVNRAFHSAAHKILLSSEEVKMDKFYFSGPDSENPTGADADSGWTALVLHFRVTWPLHLIFSPSVLECYNQLFGFLLRVKKTQRQLHKLWQIQMVNKLERWQDSRAWKIRTWLMFLVDHLQYYLQVDVLESQWAILQDALESTKDFEIVRRAHSNFLACTLSQTFLLLGSDKNEPTTTSYQKPESLKNNLVHNALSALLKLCDRFCQLVASSEEHCDVDIDDDLTQIGREVEQLVSYLLQLLASLRSQPCGTHLAQLLLRLDFNRWFSRQCTGASLTGSLTGSIT